MRAPHLLTCLALALALSAASCGLPVQTDWDPDIDFSGVGSWDWLPAAPAPTGDPRLDSDLLEQRIREAVEDELELGALRFKPGAPVDVLVTYHVGIEKALDVDTFYTSYGAGYGGGRYGSWGAGVQAHTNVREYERGTLVIDMLSADDQRLLWRGSTSARIHEGSSPTEREARVREAVAAILKRYPPD